MLTECRACAGTGKSVHENWLRHMVTMMRELGVTECDGIKLGPDPNATAEVIKPKLKTKEERKREYDLTLFASSEGVEEPDE
jgi:hypothetical protein